MSNTTTVDLRDRIAEIEDELDRIKEEAADLDPSDSEFYELNEEYEQLAHAKETLEEAIEDYGGSEFEIKTDITWGDQNQVNDLVRADMARDGEQRPEVKLGALKTRMVEVYVVSTPPNAPNQGSQYPPVVGEFLYQKVESITRFGHDRDGDEDEDFLLQQALGETN